MEPSLATSCGPQTRTRRLTSPNRATRHPAPGARPSSWPAAPTKSQGLVKEARRDYRDPGHIAYGAGVLSRRELVRNAALAAAASLVGGCERAPASPHGQLRIATGGPGGVYYVYGRGGLRLSRLGRRGDARRAAVRLGAVHRGAGPPVRELPPRGRARERPDPASGRPCRPPGVAGRVRLRDGADRRAPARRRRAGSRAGHDRAALRRRRLGPRAGGEAPRRVLLLRRAAHRRDRHAVPHGRDPPARRGSAGGAVARAVQRAHDPGLGVRPGRSGADRRRGQLPGGPGVLRRGAGIPADPAAVRAARAAGLGPSRGAPARPLVGHWHVPGAAAPRRRPLLPGSQAVNRRWVLGTGVLAAVGAAISGGTALARRGERLADPPAELRIATGPPGAVYERIGAALKAALAPRLPRTRVSTIPTGASVVNLALLARSQTELALASLDAIVAGLAAGRPTDVTAVTRLYDSWLHLLVRADSQIKAVTDLNGLAVAAGAEGSGTRFTTTRLLALAGVHPKLVTATQAEGAAMLAAGHVDAYFSLTGIPTPAVTDELLPHTPVRLIDLGAWVTKMNATYGALYSLATLPASTYPG